MNINIVSIKIKEHLFLFSVLLCLPLLLQISLNLSFNNAEAKTFMTVPEMGWIYGDDDCPEYITYPLNRAVHCSNITPGEDTIIFIESGTAEYARNETLGIRDSVTIDGNGHSVILDGSKVQEGSSNGGFHIFGGNSTIKNLVFNNFRDNAIVIRNSQFYEAGGTGGNIIQGNYIGDDGDLDTETGPNKNGIQIIGSPNNVIGGTTPEERNVIVGNTDSGILIEAGSTNNKVLGNYIGVAADGTTDLGNGKSGIVIDSSSSNIIGGPDDGTHNVISGNKESGIVIFGASAKDN
jgi:hypothetical protein